MATLKMEVHGLAELLAGLHAIDQQFSADIQDVVNATGLELRGDIIKRYHRGPHTGKWYASAANAKRTKRQRRRQTIVHQASAPGEAPQTDTGRLANGTTYYTPIDKKNRFTVVVQNDVAYAAALEYGHTYARGRKIEERPAWRPAIKKMRPLFEKRINRAIAEAVRRAT
jgi:hypothetical protein